MMPSHIRKIKKEELNVVLFSSFDRSQKYTAQWIKTSNGQWKLTPCQIEENWSMEDYEYLTSCLQHTLTTKGLVLGAFGQEGLITFASVESKALGKRGELRELTSLHVSNQYRRQGLGKTLFEMCAAWAANHGGSGLLIGANPAQETVAFYRSLGCRDAEEEELSFFSSPEDYPLIYQLPPVTLQHIDTEKKRWLDLLLLGDEQEDMIDRYLERGELYLLCWNGRVRTGAVVTREPGDLFELKNLATYPQDQGLGFGRQMISKLLFHYREKGQAMLVGTGESPVTIPFYENCGFVYSHRIKDFFTNNYDHPIMEQGVLLRDMVYLRHSLK